VLTWPEGTISPSSRPCRSVAGVPFQGAGGWGAAAVGATADGMLYAAKEAGRNQLSMHPGCPGP
jgi:hypothetical protein